MTASNTTTATATVTSADGSVISFERSGRGPAIILVDAALSEHNESARLAALLAADFTVLSYDRRGRGSSIAVNAPDAEHEVADITALVEAVGGRAYLFGSSSGAALALDAAAALGDRVPGLFLYEPPFIVDDSRPPLPADLPARIAELVARDRRSAAVTAFYREAIGIPAVFVTAMRLLMPGWKKAKRIVHTVSGDFSVLAGLQDGRPLPADRWAGLTAPTKVLAGSRSEKFFHTGAQALAEALPTVEYASLDGGHHGSAVMSPGGIADAMTVFFRR